MVKVQKTIAIIGAGPAGLAAAEVLADTNCDVHVFDAMPSPARKFLWAGKSGLNLTHAEPFEKFKSRFGLARKQLETALDTFTPTDTQRWADALNAETFVGSSGRVFPKKMKASPLLREWLRRLEAKGATLHLRHKWVGFDGKELEFETPDGKNLVQADATIFALGGASYKRLGSDAAWASIFDQLGIEIAPFKPANCGFEVNWSTHFVERFAGAPIKSVAIVTDEGRRKGEFVISQYGVEGSLVYANAARYRDQLDAQDQASLTVDLLPGKSEQQIATALDRQNKKQSFSNRLRKALKLTGAKAALLRETHPNATQLGAPELAHSIKNLEIQLVRTRPIDEAISVAGGVKWSELDTHFMVKRHPGLFVSGEMIDWEAPTGGYLLTACFATGRAAARGAINYLGLTNKT